MQNACTSDNNDTIPAYLELILKNHAAEELGTIFGTLSYSILHDSAPGLEVGLPGRISAGF